MQGFCSKCHKVWTLKEDRGVCQWCNELAIRHTTSAKPRSFKSNSRRSKRQVEAHPNGYEALEGEWASYYQVASRFTRKAQGQDRDDLLHEIMLTLATVARNNGHKPFTDGAMARIASRRVADYWRGHYQVNNGLDCGHCSKEQRARCRKDWLYPECPKAIKLESLNKPIVDAEGHVTELGELIADDQSIDLDAWLDAKTWLLGCPQRLVGIAWKRANGIALDGRDREYLSQYLKKAQKRLFST